MLSGATATRPLAAYAILAVMPLMFSSNLIIGRAAVDEMGPATLAFWRWGLSAMVLAPVAVLALRKQANATPTTAGLQAALPLLPLLGFLGMSICGTFVYVALTMTSATNATLIYTVSPVFVVLLERIFRGRELRLRESVGISVAVLGVAVIVLRGEFSALLRLDFNIGDVLILGAAFSWAVYSVLMKRDAMSRLPTSVAFTLVAAFGAAIILPSYLLEARAFGYFPQSASAWMSVAGVVLFASIGAFTAYQYGVKRVGPAVTSIFLYLLPAYGMGMAILFLGEIPRAYHGVGLVAVMAGVALATWPRKARPHGTIATKNPA
ncbi:MAG: DMT family transporter [Pseudomonadota bacterium]